MPGFTRLPFLLVALLVMVAPALDAQQMRGGGPGGGALDFTALLDPIELALENQKELELTDHQVTHLVAYHEASLERTEEAREVAAPLIEQARERLEQMRERAEQMQGQRGDVRGQRGDVRGQRGNAQRGDMQAMRERMGERGDRAQMDERTREAVQTLRAEYQQSRQELERHLSEAQVARLQELMQPMRERPGNR